MARLLFSRSASLNTGCRCLLFVSIYACPKGLHQIDHARCRSCLGGLNLFTSLFLLEEVNEGILVAVFELCGIEVTGFGVDDVSSKIKHLLGQLQLGDVLKVRGLISNFIREAQRQAQQAAVLWFERDDVLAACEHDPAECHHVHFANGVTDNSKGILSDLTIRRDVVRRINITLVDLALWNELIDVDGPRAFNLNGLELLVLDNEILAFANLIASRNVLPRDDLAGLGNPRSVASAGYRSSG